MKTGSEGWSLKVLEFGFIGPWKSWNFFSL